MVTQGVQLGSACTVLLLTWQYCMQIKKTAYAQSSQIRQIRKKMVEIMTREASSCDLKELVGKFIPEAIGELTFLPEIPIPAGSLADSPRADAQVPQSLSPSALGHLCHNIALLSSRSQYPAVCITVCHQQGTG